ncbi:hypothetical protein BTS2_1095 [Bacillus sp. TS-2]|nr:hypothetical protein BTS2_1095 [Bacillus sp. TS-2]
MVFINSIENGFLYKREMLEKNIKKLKKILKNTNIRYKITFVNVSLYLLWKPISLKVVKTSNFFEG